MAPTFQLFYFAIEGRGEVVRQVFKLAGVDFKDTRFAYPNEWFGNSKFKSKSPFGQAPWLEIDEGDGSDKVVLCQSHNITRYLARRFGLNGDSLLDQARVEMIGDCVGDYIEVPCKAFTKMADDDTKREKIRCFLEEDLPALYASLEKQLMLNNDGEGFFVSNDITWCDVYFTYRTLWLIHRRKYPTPIDKFPKLKALLGRVQAHPRVRDWFKDYPFLPKAQ